MKKINIEGIGTLEFPDQATDEQIAGFVNSTPMDQLKAIVQQQTPRSFTQDLTRQMGLAARAAGPIGAGAAVGGMLAGPPGAAAGAVGMGLGTMIVDPLVNLFNIATKSNVPGPSQLMESAMTKMGLPEPQNAQERVIQEMTRGMASAGGMAKSLGALAPVNPATTTQRVMQQAALYPAQQTLAGGTAAGAGASLREGGASPGAQLGGAMLAGMVAPGGPKLPMTQRAAALPGEMVKPFTQEGRQIIVGNVLNKLATNPQLAAENLAAGGPLVPGVRPTTAALARDPGLAASETAIRALDQSGAFPATLSSNQQSLLDAFRQIGGKPGSIPYAEAKRETITAPMRESAFANKHPVPTSAIDEAIIATLNDPAKQRKTVDDAMGYVRSLLAKRVDPETGTIDPMALYSVRKDITDAMAGKLQGEQANLKLARGELTALLPIIDNTIEAGAPGFNKYMSQYAKSSSAIDQMRILQGIESKVTTGQPNLMTGEPVLAAAALRRQLAAKQDELGAQLSAPAQRRLDNIIDEINRGQAATAPGVKAPGSDTFKNMSMGNMIGRVFSESLADNTTLRTMTRPLDFLYKLPDQQIQQLLVESMLDPQLAAQMMSKANIMKVEPLAKSLRKKAEQLGMGTYIGAEQ
jgi:hypothetical protein